MQREKLRFLPLGAPPPSHTLPGFYHSRLPGARLRAVTRNSLTLHAKARLVRGSGDGGVRTLFSAVRKAALALRGRPETRWALPPPAAPGLPPPAPGSLLPTPTPTSRPCPTRTRESICHPPAAHVGRGLRRQHPEIIQTPLRLIPPRSLCVQGQGPRPGSKPQALSPHFRGRDGDQSAAGKVEVCVTTTRGGAETAQGAGI